MSRQRSSDKLAGARDGAMSTGQNGLSTVAHIKALADLFYDIANVIHWRMRQLVSDRSGHHIDRVMAHHLLEQQLELHDLANRLYADASAYVVKSLNLPQSRIISLTSHAAENISRRSTPHEVLQMAAALLDLAHAVTKGESASITIATERLDRQIKGTAYSGSYSSPVKRDSPPQTVPESPADDPSDADPSGADTSDVDTTGGGEPGPDNGGPDSAGAEPGPEVTEVLRKTNEKDEGMEPVRFPSIETKQAIEPGAAVVISVDLLHEAAALTMGGALMLNMQAEDWSTLEVGVTLVSAAIDFTAQGKGAITIRRNLASIAADIAGTVRADVKAGQIVEVHAQFWDGTRCCGSAIRRFGVGAEHSTATQSPLASVTVSPGATKPDVTVYITLFDPNSPGSMHWRIVTEPFDGLPPRLDGIITLGHQPGTEAAQMFKEFANLPRGEHQRVIEGFGERLWKLSPPVFKAAYWALHDHYQRPLTIQFTSDDPYLPWELMRPLRENEAHAPIALRHAVARWIGAYQGWLKNELPAGDLMVVAPRYSSVATRLSLTESAAAALIKEYNATEVPGTVSGLLKLLEHPPAATVGMLYFTGHGRFNDAAASASAIKLEDGRFLQASEVDRDAVQLGKLHGSVVFFNACEVGATGAAFGEMGGWADAFLARQFRAFIAPLWAIDEEDAGNVSRILIDKVIKQCLPIGEALRDIRRDYGLVSPTIYSYLLYGDVTARVKPGPETAPSSGHAELH